MKSLAVKYRPHGWDAVVEQSSVKAILQNQLESGEVKNAYIFVGSAGCGKTTCARIFANAINHGQGAPIEMDAASNNSVEDVRNIAKMAQTKSMNSEYKVFILDEVHMFSQGAWAAMLKLIEEPPARSIFIMCTTDYWKIPKTILSRSQRYTFNRISQAGIVKRLYYILSQEWGQDADYYLNGDGALEYIARLSDGGMRDAITTLDKCLAYSTELTLDNVVKALGGSSFDELFELTDAILSSDFTKIINIVEEIYGRGDDMKQFVKGYLDFCMDIYKVKLTKSVEFTKFPDTDDFWHWIKEEFASYDLETCLKTLIKDLIALDNDIKWSQHPKNIIEARLLSL